MNLNSNWLKKVIYFLNCIVAAKPNPLAKATQNSNSGKVTVAATSVVHHNNRLANRPQNAISLYGDCTHLLFRIAIKRDAITSKNPGNPIANRISNQPL